MAVMKGDATCPDMLACSIYDTNTVYIISTVAENTRWTPIKNKFYSKTERKTVEMKFRSINVIHMYNFGMRLVDVAGQSHMKGRPDHWMRSMKWWWSIFIWRLGGYETNVYLI